MKKILGTLILFGALTANAQVTSVHSHKANQATGNDLSATELQFSVGPGFTSASNGDKLSTYAGSKTGLSLAADINLPLTREFSILTGLEYVQKGMSIDVPNANSNTTISMNYFEVPVLAQYNYFINRSNKLTAGLGPYFAFAVSRSASNDTQSQDLSSSTSSFDMGARMAIGYEPVITHDLSFVGGMHYDLGFLNTASQGDTTLANRAFVANVGVGVKL